MAANTPLIERDPKLQETYEKLKDYRARKDLKIKMNSFLKEEFTGYDGKTYPLTIRYYQVQMILHLVTMRRFLVGDDTGLGKTLEVISALTYVWSGAPDTKVIVLTTKSATPQWVAEFGKFTRGVKAFACAGTPKQRAEMRKTFEEATGPTVMVMGYRTACQDLTHIQNWRDYIVVFDEATAFKNPGTQVHQVARHMAGQASRVWAMTATLIKNNLMEGYGIFRVVVPDLFAMTPQQFMIRYCLVEMIDVPRSVRKIPKIIGYAPEMIDQFKEDIDPFYLGRPKHEVASELPALTTKTIECPLTPAQAEKYVEALDGLIEIGTTRETGPEQRETNKLTAIAYCQQVVNHLELLGCEGESEKLNTLLDLLTEGELAGEKTIIFTRFKKMVNILMPELKKAGIKAVRVTGDEDQKMRAAAQKAFQDPNDKTQVVIITMAGGDAINLQAAKAIVFYDTPWSAGDYLQILGRMIRIGSSHDKVYAIHLVAKWKKATVDQKVMEVLSNKMAVVEAVLGKRLKGESNEVIRSGSDIEDLFDALMADAAAASSGPKSGISGKRGKQTQSKAAAVPLVPKIDIVDDKGLDDLFKDW